MLINNIRVCQAQILSEFYKTGISLISMLSQFDSPYILESNFYEAKMHNDQDDAWQFGPMLPADESSLEKYFQRVGQRPAIRLDLRLTSLEELKKAAFLIAELNEVLQKLAYDDDRDAVLRVMVARDQIGRAGMLLKYHKALNYGKAKPKTSPTVTKKPARYSVRPIEETWDLNRPLNRAPKL